MTSKQRAGLRSLANGLDTVMQAEQAICNKELIKVRVLESALLTTREACETLAQAIGAEPVQCIGSRFVLFRRNEKNPVIPLA